MQANSLVSTSMQMLSLLGWTAGARLGHSLVLQLSSGLLLLGCLFLVRLSHREQIERKATASRSMLAGWTFLFTHPQRAGESAAHRYNVPQIQPWSAMGISLLRKRRFHA
ncbi:hypothetical protein [Paenibacillus dendritiformis]|uniref:hypothetical protein n=1 Tax=Paenibacillus dendritiformis TaxID=130049 RepID=UPI001F5533FB|nr:hypothetical protein [Paenibacillus dendritiformis]